MTPAALVAEVERHGGRLLLRGDRIRVEAPTPLPDALMVKLRRHKPELLAVLRSRPPSLADKLSGWAVPLVRADRIVCWLVANGAAKAKLRQRVGFRVAVYTAAEAECLLALPDNAFWGIHAACSRFGGDVKPCP